jgi:hypothetical protein
MTNMTNIMSKSNCLTDEQLQAVADNEADALARGHVAQCDTCRARMDDIRRELHALAGLANGLPAPSADLERRVRVAVAMRSDTSRGATTIRTQPAVASGGRGWRRSVWAPGLAAAALVVLAVFVIVPSVTRESRLSAAEILGRSLQTFSVARGVETLDYEVQLEGLGARALVPNGQDGTMRIQQVIDHDHAGRYRVMCFDANHTLKSIVAQDADAGMRTGRFNIDDRMYYFKFVASPDHTQPMISLPDLQRAQLRALVTVMQTTSDQKLATVQDATGTYYSIQIPPISSDNSSDSADHSAPVWDLSEARALIHASDFHLKELTARGTFLGQPFHLAFTLVQHDITTDPADDSAFAIQPQPGDIQLEGEATNDPPGDVVLAALRALGKAQP